MNLLSGYTKLATPCITPLNPPLVRGEEYGLAPSPLKGEGWGEVVQGIKQQSYEINVVQVLT